MKQFKPHEHLTEEAAAFTHRLLLIGLGLLVILAWYFWQERVFILDASYQVFSLLEQDGLPIQHQRFGGAIVFFLPKLLVLIGAPLGMVLLGYSLSFVLYPILLFLLLKRWGLSTYSWALACLFLFISAHTFFWIQSELIIATVLALVTIGVTANSSWPMTIRLFGLIPLCWLTVYTHPLGIAPLLAGWLFLLARDRGVREKSGSSRIFLAAMALALILFIARQFIFNQSNYDQAAMGMADNLLSNLTGLFGHPAMDRFMRYSLSTQLPMTIVLSMIIYYYLQQKQYWRLAAVAAPFFAWLCLIVCAWPWAPDRFYIESYYYVFGSILALPFVLDVLPRLGWKWSKRLLIGFVVFRIVMIVLVSPPYQSRLVYLQEKVSVLQAQEQERLLIQRDRLDMQRLKMEWALSFESLMLSTYADPERPRTIMAIEGDPPDYCKDPNLASIPTSFGSIGYERLANQTYIQLSDTGAVTEIQIDW